MTDNPTDEYQAHDEQRGRMRIIHNRRVNRYRGGSRKL